MSSKYGLAVDQMKDHELWSVLMGSLACMSPDSLVVTTAVKRRMYYLRALRCATELQTRGRQQELFERIAFGDGMPDPMEAIKGV